jgi:hypothetical protein
MLYLIGGAARTGKTILARRLFHEQKVPYFCVDYFVSALEQGSPETGIESEAPTLERASKLWPRLAPMLRNIVEVEPRYVVEGDALLPSGVAALIQQYPGQVRACYIGYACTTPERKLAEIRRFGGGVNDWIQDHTDEYILALCTEMIGFSQYMQQECNTYCIPYFDVSDDFSLIIERAYQAICDDTSADFTSL